MSKPKRRLPVLPSGPLEEPVPDRPRWQWVVGCAGALVLAWLVLATAVTALGDAFAESAAGGALLVALHAFALALAGLGAGHLVGRFGGAAKGREAALGGVLAAAVTCGLAAISAPELGLTTGALAFVVTGAIASATAYAGARLGLRKR